MNAICYLEKDLKNGAYYLIMQTFYPLTKILKILTSLQVIFLNLFLSLFSTNLLLNSPCAHGISIWWVHAKGTGCPSCSREFWWWSRLSGPYVGCWVPLGKSPSGCIAAGSLWGRAAASSQRHSWWCTAWPLLPLPGMHGGIALSKVNSRSTAICTRKTEYS